MKPLTTKEKKRKRDRRKSVISLRYGAIGLKKRRSKGRKFRKSTKKTKRKEERGSGRNRGYWRI